MINNNLIPIVTETPSNIGFGYYKLCGNGIFLHKPVMGKSEVIIKVDGISGYDNEKEAIKMVNPKIPISYFWKIIEFFRYVRSSHKSNIEACAAITYSFEENKFMIYVPKHKATMASIEYDFKEFYKQYKNWYIIVMIHCHPGSGANFSSQDDKDDNRDRFEGVVGNIDNPIPSFCFRFGTMGKFFNVNIDDIFNNSKEEVTLNFEEAIKKISISNSSNYTNVGYTIPAVVNTESILRKYKDDRDFKLDDLFASW